MLQEAVRKAEQLPAGAELIKEGDARRPTFALLSGWAGKLRVLADGRRQIFAFLVPGDPIGTSLCGQELASTIALTPVLVAPAPFLRDTASDAQGARQGFGTFARGMMEREAAYLLSHIVRIGRLTAYERLLDLMREFQGRLAEVGLVGPAGFPLPLTQEMLADSLGLSIVHVNRTLQQLRRDRMLVLRDSVASLPESPVVPGRTAFKHRPASAGPYAPS